MRFELELVLIDKAGVMDKGATHEGSKNRDYFGFKIPNNLAVYGKIEKTSPIGK